MNELCIAWKTNFKLVHSSIRSRNLHAMMHGVKGYPCNIIKIKASNGSVSINVTMVGSITLPILIGAPSVSIYSLF